MSKIHIRHPHSLSREEAKLRVEEIAKTLEEQLSLRFAWRGDRLLFRRSGASGVIELPEGAVDVTIELGMLLAPMKSRIEQTLRERIHSALVDNQGPTLV